MELLSPFPNSLLSCAFSFLMATRAYHDGAEQKLWLLASYIGVMPDFAGISMSYYWHSFLPLLFFAPLLFLFLKSFAFLFLFFFFPVLTWLFGQPVWSLFSNNKNIVFGNSFAAMYYLILHFVAPFCQEVAKQMVA